MAPTSEEYQKCKDLFDDLVSEVRGTVKKYWRPSKKFTARSRKRELILKLYTEVIRILERTLMDMRKYTALRKQEDNYWPKKRPREKVSQKLTQIFHKDNALRDYLIIDVECLLQWAFIIDGTLGKGTIPKSITQFRNVFLVHLPDRIAKPKPRTNQKLITINKAIRRLMPSSTFSAQGSPHLLFFPFYSSKKAFRGIVKLEREVKPYIPEVAKEKNHNNKIRIIWENLDKLPEAWFKGNPARNENHFTNRLSRYGGRSPSIELIISALLIAWKKRAKSLWRH